MITFKITTYYEADHSGEIVCNKCAGYALRTDIANNPRAGKWHNYNGEVFSLPTIETITEMRAEFGAVCNCEMEN